MTQRKRWSANAMSLLALVAIVLAACQPTPLPGGAATPAGATPGSGEPAATPAGGETPAGTAGTQLEMFSWWTTGGEAAGLNAMAEIYKQKYPGVEFINATVAGGAGSNAKAVLASRMLGGDPPDSFQVHMGRELDTWVIADKVEPLDELFTQEGFDKVFPQGVLDIISSDGHYWSVPVNIHRANVLWYNTKVFADNNLTPPTTFDEFFAACDTLEAAGLTCLALGDNGIWASVHLFETVLIGTLGAEGYIGLWNGTTAWTDPKVGEALTTFQRMIERANDDHAALSWDQANQLVIDGKAGMTIMGDWVDADNLAKGFADSGWAPAPGNEGIYDALSDTFALPVGAKSRDNALNWLRLAGSKEGQEAFNPVKGSICARTDCDRNLFGPYLQSAMDDWQSDTIVPSLAHGAAANEAWVLALSEAMTAFVSGGDVTTMQAALAVACQTVGVCK